MTASGDAAEPGPPQEAVELAAELRSIIEALAVAEVSPEAIRDATELARAARKKLLGPRQRRWYDDDANAAAKHPESRRAYSDQSPVRGELNPIAPPLVVEYTTRPDGTRVVRGRARLGLAYEGPPHGVHGGWVAALFDDLLGSAQMLGEQRGVTARLEVKYRRVTPLDEDLWFEAWIAEQRGRRIVVHGTCHAGGALTAEATGLFIGVDFNDVRRRTTGEASS